MNFVFIVTAAYAVGAQRDLAVPLIERVGRRGLRCEWAVPLFPSNMTACPATPWTRADSLSLADEMWDWVADDLDSLDYFGACTFNITSQMDIYGRLRHVSFNLTFSWLWTWTGAESVARAVLANLRQCWQVDLAMGLTRGLTGPLSAEGQDFIFNLLDSIESEKNKRKFAEAFLLEVR